MNYGVQRLSGYENAPNPFANQVNDSMVMRDVKQSTPMA